MSLYTETEVGVVVELYRLVRPGKSAFYTSGDADVVYGGSTYRRASIKRGAIPTAFSPEREELSIEASVDNVFSFLLADEAANKLTLTVYRYAVATATAQQIFSGTMDSYQLSSRKATVTFLSDGYKMDEDCPRTLITQSCNHQHYDEHCGLARNDWRVTVKVTAIEVIAESTYVTLTNWGPNNFGKHLSDYTAATFDFSTLEYNGQYRMITESVATVGAPDDRTCKLLSPFADEALVVGNICYLYLGCNRDKDTCVNRFNNLAHFHGFTNVPSYVPDGTVVPLAYGTVIVPCTAIKAIIGALGVTPSQTYIHHLWNVVCFGPVKYLRMFCDKKPYPNQAYDLTVPAELALSMTGYSTGEPDNTVVPAVAAFAFTGWPLPGIAHFWQFGLTVDNTQIPNGDYWKARDVSVEVRRDPADSGCPVTPTWITGNLDDSPVPYDGASPAAVIYDLMTNTLYGAGMDADMIDLTSFNTVSAYCETKGYALNILYDKPLSIRRIVADICEIYGLMLIIDGNGKLSLLAVNSPDALTPVAALTQDDIESISLSRGSWDSTFNRFIAEVESLGLGPLGYTHTTRIEKIVVNNQAVQMLTGKVRSKQFNFKGFGRALTTPNYPAFSRLYEIMKDLSIPRISGSIRVPLKYDYLVKGQSIRITHSDYGLDAIFRIQQRDFPDNDQDMITLEILQISEALYDSNYDVYGDNSLRSGNVLNQNDYEYLYFDPYASTSDTSTGTYTQLAAVVVQIDNGDNGFQLLVKDTDYTINDEGAGLVSITLLSPWSAAVEANSLGELFVAIYQAE